MGGSVKGYENKYAKIAERVSTDHGLTVFVASTPIDSWEGKNAFNNFELIMNCIAKYMEDFEISDYFVYTMGISAGGSFLLWYAYLYPMIKRVLAVNPVLRINLHRTKDGIAKFNGDFIILIFGEQDPSACFAPLLDSRANVVILSDTDHQFRGNLEEFIELPEKYIFNHQNEAAVSGANDWVYENAYFK